MTANDPARIRLDFAAPRAVRFHFARIPLRSRFLPLLVVSCCIAGCADDNSRTIDESTTDSAAELRAEDIPATPTVGDLPQLIEALGSDDYTVVLAAAKAIETLGPDGKEAAPALVQALSRYRNTKEDNIDVMWNGEHVPLVSGVPE